MGDLTLRTRLVSVARVLSGERASDPAASAWNTNAASSSCRRILVMSNCQTGGLAAALRAMCPEDEVRQLAWTGAEPPGFLGLLGGATALVTSMPRGAAHESIEATASSAQLVIVPQVFFGGFHPDLTTVPLLVDGRPARPELQGVARSYHSRLVLWGWFHGVGAREIESWFTPNVFGRVGYYERWAPAMELLGQAMAESDLDLGRWLLPLVGRGTFMLTDNHPRIDAIVQLARLVAVQLGVPEERTLYPWELVIPDGLLATAEVWPLYPGVADQLGLDGGYCWRLASGELLGLSEFIERSLAGYQGLDRLSLSLDHVTGNSRFADALGIGAAS